VPTIAAVFGAEAAIAQLTVTLFLMAFAASQLVYGPLSDRFGRRWVLIGGLGLYALAGLACALAPAIGVLIGARVLQALGGGAGPVVARAVIRDLYDRERAARVFSYIGMFQCSTMLAPILGGYLHEAFGWRAIFLVLAGAGALFVALMIVGVPETNVRQDPTALRPGQMGRNVAELLTDRSYVAYVLVNALMFGGQFAFISGSSFVLIGVLGVSPSGFGLCFGSVALGIMTGTFLSGRFGARLGLDRMILSGTVLGAAAGLLMATSPERRPDGGRGDRPDVRVRDRPRPDPAQRHGRRGRPGPAHGRPRRRGGRLPPDDGLGALQRGGRPLLGRHRAPDDPRDRGGRSHRARCFGTSGGDIGPACCA
jgi:DHA1 family bicyclomycin/chloramphenicol resistance-like MFS transporter